MNHQMQLVCGNCKNLLVEFTASRYCGGKVTCPTCGAETVFESTEKAGAVPILGVAVAAVPLVSHPTVNESVEDPKPESVEDSEPETSLAHATDPEQ
jgi:hypothetical protein